MYVTTVDCTLGGEPSSLAPAAAAARWTKAVSLYASVCFSQLQEPSLVLAGTAFLLSSYRRYVTYACN